MLRIDLRRLQSLLLKYLKWLAGPLIIAVLSFIIINPSMKKLRGPEQYYIYVASNFDDTTSVKIRDKFEMTLEDLNLKIDGLSIGVKRKDDKGDPAKAKVCASEIANEDDVLMVVGHFYSNTTAEALPTYLGADPQIPVILTTETNPQLLPSEKNDNPIYCLSPDDNNQAEIAAQYATYEEEDQNFWVVQDIQNRIYSNFLANRFIEEVQEKKNKKVLLLSDSNIAPSVETLRALDIDCIFFAGLWQNALILIHQLNKIYKDVPKPKIILSDACVDDRLISQGKDAVEGVFLTHQLNAEEYRSEGWEKYGREAAHTIEGIIREANNVFEKSSIRYWLDIHRVSDAREAIKEAMKTKYKGVYRKDSNFRVWQIKRIIKEDGNTVYEFRDWEE